MGKKMAEIIESNPEILGGKPVIKGTRIPVDLIFELIGAETPIEEILEDYAALTKEVIRQLLKIGNDAIKNLQNVNFNLYLEQLH
jgi:uncharacterized protein (DUF433 family)